MLCQALIQSVIKRGLSAPPTPGQMFFNDGFHSCTEICIANITQLYTHARKEAAAEKQELTVNRSHMESV